LPTRGCKKCLYFGILRMFWPYSEKSIGPRPFGGKGGGAPGAPGSANAFKPCNIDLLSHPFVR